MATITLPAGSTSSDLQTAINGAASGDIIELSSDMNFSGAVTVPASLSITIRSATGTWTMIQTVTDYRHFIVEGSLTLANIILDGGYAARGSDGGGIYVSGAALVMNAGAVIRNCAAITNGAGIFLQSSTFIMNDGEISNNHQSTTYGGSGGGVYMINSTFTMYDGVITGNSAVWGGGVDVNQESTFTMNGGEISNNKTTVEDGGGVHVYVHGTFIMNGGEISNNISNATGGGVFVGQGSHVSGEPTDWCRFIMNGGSIEYNSAGIGGGVAAAWNGQIEMYGGSIANNTAAAGGGVFLTTSQYEDNGVSFTMKGGEITGNTATVAYGGGIWARGDVTQYIVKVVIGDDTGVATTTPLIYGNTAISQGGGIFLYGDNANASMYDGKIYGNTAGSLGGGICIYAGSTLAIHGGVIGGENPGDANTAETSGGGIATINGSNTFTMTGGEIIGNNANSTGSGGGGIYLANVSYSITGGEIRGNTAANNGGGLYVASSAVASAPISHISIANNRASELGGGAYIAGIVNVEDVIISYNNANNGGGVYLPGAGALTALGGTSFTNNSAANNGGGIFSEDYDYSNPSSTSAYQNITTSQDTIFRGNLAVRAYYPPINASDFVNIGYATTSIVLSGEYLHPLNNYDINYVRPTPLDLFSVIYNANGGIGSYTDSGIPSGTVYTLLSLLETGITRPGYAFAGWNTAADGSGTAYAPGDTILITENVTLYAQWTRIEGPYDVIYDANGGIGSYTDTGVPSGLYTVLSLLETGITRPGYTFTGWNTAADGSGTAYAPGDTFTITGNVVLYAQWVSIEGPYQVTYCPNCPNSCNNKCYTDADIPGGTVYTILSPEEIGVCCPCYVFIGWNTQPNGSGTTYSPGDTIVITEDVVLYAQWAPNSIPGRQCCCMCNPCRCMCNPCCCMCNSCCPPIRKPKNRW